MYSKLIHALSRRGGEEEERDSSQLIQHIPEIEIHYAPWKKDVTLPEADPGQDLSPKMPEAIIQLCNLLPTYQF